jgi:hypothetical protein
MWPALDLSKKKKKMWPALGGDSPTKEKGNPLLLIRIDSLIFFFLNK